MGHPVLQILAFKRDGWKFVGPDNYGAAAAAERCARCTAVATLDRRGGQFSRGPSVGLPTEIDHRTSDRKRRDVTVWRTKGWKRRPHSDLRNPVEKMRRTSLLGQSTHDVRNFLRLYDPLPSFPHSTTALTNSIKTMQPPLLNLFTTSMIPVRTSYVDSPFTWFQ